jgi:hypothetical protein
MNPSTAADRDRVEKAFKAQWGQVLAKVQVLLASDDATPRKDDIDQATSSVVSFYF